MVISKEYFERDLDTFMNLEEFSDYHSINGREISVIKDNDRLQERTKKEYDGIYVGDMLYFVKVSEYGSKPKIDEIQIFDGMPATIFDVKEDMGMYEIILKFNRS